VFAAGLEAAQRIIDDGKIAAFVKARYASFGKGDGAKFEKGQMKFEELAALAKDYGKIGMTSGKQERLENLINQYIIGK
jgi:xylose isomerase